MSNEATNYELSNNTDAAAVEAQVDILIEGVCKTLLGRLGKQIKLGCQRTK